MSKTIEQVKQDFRQRGITVEQWARENGFRSDAVRNVLAGRSKGYFGNGHKIQVALGIKDQPK